MENFKHMPTKKKSTKKDQQNENQSSKQGLGWYDDDVLEIIIELVEQRKPLWDKSDKKYSDNIARGKAWKDKFSWIFISVPEFVLDEVIGLSFGISSRIWMLFLFN
jgi:hypothetical protein